MARRDCRAGRRGARPRACHNPVVPDGLDLRVYRAGGDARAGLVLAHGAGAGQSSPFITSAARGLAARGTSTVTFDFAYMAEGRRIPDRGPVLEARWRSAVAEARRALGPGPLFIGGKSMGGRIASQVAAAGGLAPLAGLVFLGYPLHPPGRPERRRDAHLPGIAEPMLFVQGGRDPFGTAEEIRAILPALKRASLHEVPGGDHSFKVPGGPAAQPRALDEALDAVARWIERASGGAGV